MANSYTQLYAQMVFAVKNRQSLILPENRIKIEKYICGIASNIHCNPILNGKPDMALSVMDNHRLTR